MDPIWILAISFFIEGFCFGVLACMFVPDIWGEMRHRKWKREYEQKLKKYREEQNKKG